MNVLFLSEKYVKSLGLQHLALTMLTNMDLMK